MARYIDADLFKENTNPVWFCATNGYCGLYDKKDIEDMIDAQPTADVTEIEHGHWVTVELKNGRTEIYCSNCHWGCLYDEEGKHVKTPRCPHCGAEMEADKC